MSERDQERIAKVELQPSKKDRTDRNKILPTNNRQSQHWRPWQGAGSCYNYCEDLIVKVLEVFVAYWRQQHGIGTV